MTTALFYAGTEVPGWRALLDEQGVEHVALSYMGLRRRTKFANPWMIEEKYPARQKVLLDSGCHTLNKDPGKYTDEQVQDFAEHYYAWAYANAYRVEFVTEFDALQLGPEWIANRRAFHGPSFGDKFTPVWHPEYGLNELDLLATRFKRVAIMQTALGARDLAPTLNNLVRQHGVKLHGIAMTKPGVIRDVDFATVSSTSWISPSQFGDTIIWAGNELHRYPKKYKVQARTRHYRDIQTAGFDAQAILEDSNPLEILRLSIWSWEHLMHDINDHRAVTPMPETPTTANTETPPTTVATTTPQTRNPTIQRDVTRPLPFIKLATRTETTTDAHGVRQEREIQVLTTTGTSVINCNSCYINRVCDAFLADHTCAYDTQVTLRTRTQRDAADDTMEEILYERAIRGYLMEQANGGYPDSNVSSEFDRYAKFKRIRAETAQDRFTAKIEVSQQGNMGMISRIFGEQAGESARALNAPQDTNDVRRQLGVVDAEIIGEVVE